MKSILKILNLLNKVDPILALEIEQVMTTVEKRLNYYLTQENVFVDTTSKHLMLAGGKRVRPLLTLMSSYIAKGINDKVIDAAVVVELTHLATLYHDDVMDSAILRRGIQTAHSIWGNNIAILTGDLLFAKASLIVSKLGSEALKIQARTFERLCLGQINETIGPQNNEDPYDHYMGVIVNKTSSLIATASEFGALFSHADKNTRQILRDYGEKIGIAFQLSDDIIDITSTQNKSGKMIGTDLREGVPTLPTLLLRKSDDRETILIVDDALKNDESLQDAINILSKHRVMKESWRIVRQYAEEAKNILNPLPDSPAKKILQTFALAIVDRNL